MVKNCGQCDDFDKCPCGCFLGYCKRYGEWVRTFYEPCLEVADENADEQELNDRIMRGGRC